MLLEYLKSIDVKDLEASRLNYYPLVRGRTTSSAFMKIVIDNINEVEPKELPKTFKLLQSIMTELYPKINSRDVNYSRIRNKLKEKYPKDSPEFISSLENMKLSKQEKKKKISSYNKSVKSRNRNKEQVSMTEVTEVINETLQSDDPYTKAIGLLIVSGCRPIELLLKNKFKPVKGKPSWVNVANLGKKRQGKEDMTVNRPLLRIGSRVFKKLVKELRENLKNKDLISPDGQLKKNILKSLRIRTQKYFPEQSTKYLRKIYGNMAYETYADKSTTGLAVFLSDILGHSPEDISTASSYSNVNINTQEDLINQKLNKIIDLLQTKR